MKSAGPKNQRKRKRRGNERKREIMVYMWDSPSHYVNAEQIARDLKERYHNVWEALIRMKKYGLVGRRLLKSQRAPNRKDGKKGNPQFGYRLTKKGIEYMTRYNQRHIAGVTLNLRKEVQSGEILEAIRDYGGDLKVV